MLLNVASVKEEWKMCEKLFKSKNCTEIQDAILHYVPECFADDKNLEAIISREVNKRAISILIGTRKAEEILTFTVPKNMAIERKAELLENGWHIGLMRIQREGEEPRIDISTSKRYIA